MQPACCDVTMSQEDEDEVVHNSHDRSMFDHVHSEEFEEQKAQETSMDSFATIYTVWDKVRNFAIFFNEPIRSLQEF